MGLVIQIAPGKADESLLIEAIRYARENRLPYLGICLGMQLAVIEFARNVANLSGAHSTEFDPATPHPVIALITEWQNRDGSIEKRTEKSRIRSRTIVAMSRYSTTSASSARRPWPGIT